MSHASTSWNPGLAAWRAPAVRDPAIGRGGGWTLYLALMALLVPVLTPTLPGQATILDGLNIVVLAAFAFQVLARRARIQVPLVVPMFLVAIGSLIAVTNAESFGKSALTLGQDAYLFIWFVLLVNVLRDRGDQIGFRIAWIWAANLAAAIGLGLLLTDGRTSFGDIFGARGNRAVGLFDGPNALADYLMMSLFVVVSLAGQTRRALLWGSVAFQLIGLVATKSNGAMLSWVLGMALFFVIRASVTHRATAAAIGTALVAGAILVAGWWAQLEWGSGIGAIREIQKKSFLGRFEHSAEGRQDIWKRLLQTYPRHPLGIGPGNSSEQRVSIGQRERKRSYQSKEAHSDFLGYLVERGPLGALGLLLLVTLPFVAAWSAFRNGTEASWRAGPGAVILGAFAGGLLATTVHSLFMEKLHFRHYWLFLAMVYAFAAAPAAARMGARGGARLSAGAPRSG